MKRRIKLSLLAALALCCGLAVATWACMAPVAVSLQQIQAGADTLRVTDRNGQPLTVTYQNRWNVYDRVPLYALPPLLQKSFVMSEDKRFFDHGGVDWQARASALVQDLLHLHIVRGASTLTEQVVRMINPRPRTFWSKWLEGFEAEALEQKHSKAEILEFYLNQVPYAANRRGVAQAARYYFNRDLSTLSPKETLALAVLARAPSSYDLYNNADKIDKAIDRLAETLAAAHVLKPADLAAVRAEKFTLEKPALPVNAAHFASYVRSFAPAGTQSADGHAIHTTLDAAVQASVQKILDDRVRVLRHKNLNNAAALVVDHTTGEILAWVVAGAGDDSVPGNKIDAVTTPRQPGSSMKPLLYTLALDDGWTPATIINDAPLSEAIGSGLHRFKNYSNTFYGHITLREALANSLNIPALVTINHVGVQKYLSTLHRLHFDSLDRGAQVYDEGLALGDGEVTLYELVQGYTALANRGTFRPLRAVMDDPSPLPATQIYTPEAASLIGNILSDPWARRLEFGSHSVLDFPVQTAVKTGTSTDYRDAWSVGFNDRYVVGIWMGNLDQKPTDGITGSTGPSLALRAIFSELNHRTPSHPLWLSPKLVQKDVCVQDPQDAARCYMRSEYFVPGTEPGAQPETAAAQQAQHFDIVKPTDGLQLAVDPRIPQDAQKLAFTMHGLRAGQAVDWIVNGALAGTSGEHFLWPVSRGHYTLQARVHEGDKLVFSSSPISYIVK